MLRLGIPSKGRLQDETLAWFGARGISIARSRAGREYAGRVSGVAGVELVLLSAAEIPRELAAGRLHLGVTGQDLVREEFAGWDRHFEELVPMGFGFADLVVAVPAIWIDVADMSDLDEVAGAFRARHGHRLRVATKYHRLTRGFFQAHGVADYQLIASQGATEATIRNKTAEAIVDITSTGSTLRDNHLKVLDDGLILRSQATLFASQAARWDSGALRARGVLAERVGPRP